MKNEKLIKVWVMIGFMCGAVGISIAIILTTESVRRNLSLIVTFLLVTIFLSFIWRLRGLSLTWWKLQLLPITSYCFMLAFLSDIWVRQSHAWLTSYLYGGTIFYAFVALGLALFIRPTRIS